MNSNDALPEQTIRHSHVEERYRRAVLLHYRLYLGLSLLVFHLDAFAVLLVQAALHDHRDSGMGGKIQTLIENVFVVYFGFQYGIGIVGRGRRTLQGGLHVEILAGHGRSGGDTLLVQLVAQIELARHSDVHAQAGDC